MTFQTARDKRQPTTRLVDIAEPTCVLCPTFGSGQALDLQPNFRISFTTATQLASATAIFTPATTCHMLKHIMRITNVKRLAPAVATAPLTIAIIFDGVLQRLAPAVVTAPLRTYPTNTTATTTQTLLSTTAPLSTHLVAQTSDMTANVHDSATTPHHQATVQGNVGESRTTPDELPASSGGYRVA